MLLFELYYVSFGQAIAAFAPNELLASLLVPIFFLFVVAFCGVVMPYAGILKFWCFVYWVSPFKYLVSGFMGVLVHDVPCAARRMNLRGSTYCLTSLSALNIGLIS